MSGRRRATLGVGPTTRLVRKTGIDMDYDRIGQTYTATRRADPRLRAVIAAPVPEDATVADVGAGSGSYELSQTVVAVEPSAAMIGQRRPGAALAIRAVAEALPLRDGAVDVVTAVLTTHHWSDRRRGLAECRRVARQCVVVFTHLPPDDPWWLHDYFPSFLGQDRHWFPSRDVLLAEIGGDVEITPWPVPGDCLDGFQGAFWRRPSQYLDPAVRDGISSFHRLDRPELDDGLARLAADLGTGAWSERHGDLLDRDELDLGYRRLVIR